MHDDQYIACLLRGRDGSLIHLDRDREALIRRVQQALAGHLVGPLTQQLDAGQPAAIGHLTVDQPGIRYRDGAAAGSWSVSWQQVIAISAGRYGTEVSVTTRQGRKRTGLSSKVDDKDGFLATQVLQHAANRAGVLFSAG